MISAGQKAINLANKTLENPTTIDFYTGPHYALIIYFVVHFKNLKYENNLKSKDQSKSKANLYRFYKNAIR